MNAPPKLPVPKPPRFTYKTWAATCIASALGCLVCTAIANPWMLGAVLCALAFNVSFILFVTGLDERNTYGW